MKKVIGMLVVLLMVASLLGLGLPACGGDEDEGEEEEEEEEEE
jgi:type II secretory pathway pseudopilin PulG